MGQTAAAVPTGDLLDLSDQSAAVVPSTATVAQPEAVGDLLQQVFAGSENASPPAAAAVESVTSPVPAATPSTASEVNLLEEILGGTSTPAAALAEPAPT